MSETERLIVTYAPAESGNRESRWIRVAQVGLQDESISLDEAAGIIDALFDLEPCDSGMGGGGNAAEDEPPDEDRFKDAMAAMFRRPGMCEEERFWTALVDILRSHKTPDYELRLTYGEVAGILQIRESVREVVEVNGAVVELSMPYDGGLSGVPAGVNWEVRGSTLNLERPLNARLTLRYNTWYERATITVPTGFEEKNDPVRRAAREYAPGDIYAVGGYPSSKKFDRPELPESDVIAFWGSLAASCALVRPNAQDESVDSREIWDVCNPQRDDSPSSGEEPCIGYVHHYTMCECSRKRIDGEVTTEEIRCPECGGGLSEEACEKKKHRDQFDGYVYCDEQEPLHDPEYYRGHCCKSPQTSSDLPRCRRMYRQYYGGHEIESGPEHWKNIYGEDVSMVAVLPEGGVCGDEITEWNVPQRNCCDGVPPLEPSSENPEHIYPGGTYLIKVGGGKDGELTWRATGGLTFRDSGGTTYKTASRGVYVVAGTGICPNPTVTVDDGCRQLRMQFRGPDNEGPKLPYDMLVAPETRFSVTASGGVPPYMWQASGVDLQGWSPDGATAYFKTREKDVWCSADITVVDVCGQDSTMKVMNAAKGVWELVPRSEYDPCNPPGAHAALDHEDAQGIWSKPNGGYYVWAAWTFVQSRTYQGGSCSYRAGLWNDCATNNVIVSGSVRGPNQPNYCQGSSGNTQYEFVAPGCCRRHNVNDSQGRNDLYTSWWQYTVNLYKWVCADE